MRQSMKRFATAVLLLAGVPLVAQAAIDGLTGTSFSFTAKQNYISTADGGSLFFWGYSDDAGSTLGLPQYPGPTLIVDQGDTVTITLGNTLDEPVSLIFPGQSGVSATCLESGVDTTTLDCVTGKLTLEAIPNGEDRKSVV